MSIVTLLLSWMLAAPALAQSAGGVAGISGVVRDASGASVPNAKVVISTGSQGTVRAIITNNDGVFTAPALDPGPGYRVTVTAAGFNIYDATHFDLKVGQNVDLRIALTVGQATTQVDVTAEAPVLDDTKVDVSTVVDTRSIMDLPIDGRRVDSFVLLTPGVTNDANFGLLSFRGVAGNNSFLIDGNDGTEQFYDENAGRTRIAANISQDAVQEFQVLTSDFSAEYGRAMGGVVNTVTRSGGNQFHGTGYWFFRNQDFNARDPLAAFNPAESRHQVGGSVGGPILKDKLFFFGNVEVTRRNFPMIDSVVSSGIVDSTNQTWVGCGAPATPAQCSAINQLLPRFFGQIPRTLHQELYFGRLDYRLSDRNTLSASLNFLHDTSPNGIQTGATSTSGSAINGNGDDAVRVRNGRFTWTAVPKASFVNEFRFGWFTDRQADTFDNALLGAGLGYLGVSVAGVGLGQANYLPRVEPSESRYQFVDNAAWTKGKHTVKFGADIASTEDYTYFISNAFGSYTYQTVTAFALDYTGNTYGKNCPNATAAGTPCWQRYVQAFGNPIVDATINEYALYLQDQWRATPRLTVNLGVRWEYSQAPQPPVTNPDYPQTGKIHTSPNNLGPRAGVTYRLNDRTVLRAGYGIYYARFLGSLIDNLWTTNGLYQTADTLNNNNSAQAAAGPVFPNTLTAPVAGTAGASTVQYVVPNLKTPYSQQGSLAIERQLTSDIGLTASYIWSRGTQLYSVTDVNAPAMSGSVTYTINDINGNPVNRFTTPVYAGARPNPKYGAVYQDANGIDSYYNALAVTVSKRFTRGLQGLFSYTWSHEIDDGQGGGGNALFFNSIPNTYNGNYRFDQGSGSLDQRHRAVISFIWAPKFSHRTDAFFKYVVNNWQLASITSLSSGHVAGSESVRVVSSAISGALSTSTLNGFTGSSRAPFLPVNNLYLPPIYREDARISKVFPIGGDESPRRLYFNFEAFNLCNGTEFTGMSTQGFTASGLVITPTPAAFGVGNSDSGNPDGNLSRHLQLSLRFVF
jgi:outer membrane receptor protein involved in Fe transport